MLLAKLRNLAITTAIVATVSLGAGYGAATGQCEGNKAAPANSPTNPQSPVAEPQKAKSANGSIRDFTLPESGSILTLVLSDWFTSSARREEALFLLNDIPSEPSGTPRPELRRIVIDSRTVPKDYTPKLPDVSTILSAGDKGPIVKGELKITIEQFEPGANGMVMIEFYESNYGFTSNSVRYRAKKDGKQYKVEYIDSDLSSMVAKLSKKQEQKK